MPNIISNNYLVSSDTLCILNFFRIPSKYLLTVGLFKSWYKYNAHITFGYVCSVFLNLEQYSLTYFFPLLTWWRIYAFIKRDVRNSTNSNWQGVGGEESQKMPEWTPTFSRWSGKWSFRGLEKSFYFSWRDKMSKVLEPRLKDERLKILKQILISQKQRFKPPRKCKSKPL